MQRRLQACHCHGTSEFMDLSASGRPEADWTQNIHMASANTHAMITGTLNTADPIPAIQPGSGSTLHAHEGRVLHAVGPDSWSPAICLFIGCWQLHSASNATNRGRDAPTPIPAAHV